MKELKTVSILTLLAFLLAGCTDNTSATRVLQQQGYTNIRMTGYRAFMGSDDDTYSTGFEATSPSGQHVTGAVTGGMLKGWTIRLD